MKRSVFFVTKCQKCYLFVDRICAEKNRDFLLTNNKAYIKIAKVAMRWAQIAQLVEQRTENPRVTGSIPVLGIPQEAIYGG